VITSVFMLGLLPFSGFYVLFRGFYAVEDTRTPFLVSILMNVVALGIAVPAFYLVDSGAQVAVLAAGYVCGFWATFIVSWIVLARRLGGMQSLATLRALLRMALAGLLVLAAAFATQWLLVTTVTGGGPSNRIGIVINVVVVSAVGALFYVVLARVLRIGEVTEVVSMLKSRLRQRGVQRASDESDA
jgi:putative peptidoglycan lipid II flippase